MPEEEPSGNVPEDSRAAIDSAWETFRHARRKRHVLHDLVRELQAARVPDQYDPLGRDIDRSMGARRNDG
jgi:hypothetical protein